jgi:tRNA threonylcarbamoyladenosine biosynthesis protein TsaE
MRQPQPTSGDLEADEPIPAVFSDEVVTNSPAQTQAVAGALAQLARPGDLVLLGGGLGAGKTTFAKGFAAAFGVQGPVTSPTFTLVRQYACRGTVTQLVHADVYRLDSFHEVADLGLAEFLEDGAVVLVEWGEAVAPVLGDSSLTIHFDSDQPNEPSEPAELEEWRRLRVVAKGPGWIGRADDVAHALATALGSGRRSTP